MQLHTANTLMGASCETSFSHQVDISSKRFLDEGIQDWPCIHSPSNHTSAVSPCNVWWLGGEYLWNIFFGVALTFPNTAKEPRPKTYVNVHSTAPRLSGRPPGRASSWGDVSKLCSRKIQGQLMALRWVGYESLDAPTNINKLDGLGLKVTKEIVTYGSLWTVSRFPKIGVPPNHPF